MNAEVRKATEDACDALYAFYKEGLVLPGYTAKRGKPYLYKLFTNWIFNESRAVLEYNTYWQEAFEKHLPQLRAIAGPHGWAMLKILMHKAEQRRKREEKTKIRNKKAKQARNERAWHTRLQID